MLGALKYALSNLLNFEGRDARQTFWYYVLLLYIATVVVTFLVAIPAYARMIAGMMKTVSLHPDDPTAINGVMASSMSELMISMLWLSFGSAIVTALLFAASLVRRLHDSDLSGWWALLPAVCQIGALALLPQQIGQMTTMMEGMYSSDPAVAMGSFQNQFQLFSLIGWIPWIALIVFGVRKSTPGPNRYGEGPVSF
jgi:uncharacterized membrane protein YhaH (DUF805 family)